MLLEETDWIGGQMAAAAVTTMDEDSVWMKFPVRERGLYREFNASMVLHYLTMEKDPQVAVVIDIAEVRRAGVLPIAFRNDVEFVGYDFRITDDTSSEESTTDEEMPAEEMPADESADAPATDEPAEESAEEPAPPAPAKKPAQKPARKPSLLDEVGAGVNRK